jgi:hypothetical protein
LFLHESLFNSIQDYENNGRALPLPLAAFPTLFPKLVFIILVDDPDFRTYLLPEDYVGIDGHIHLYGEITAMDLIIASCTHSEPEDVLRQREWQKLWDRSTGEEALARTERPKYWRHCIQSMTLHEHARFSTTEEYPIDLLQDKESDTDPFFWSVDVPDMNDFNISPKLDIRHLRLDDVGCVETIQACVCLMQTNSILPLGVNCHPGADVICRSDIVMPLFRTVGTVSSIQTSES